jgi:hypothetical protein
MVVAVVLMLHGPNAAVISTKDVVVMSPSQLLQTSTIVDCACTTGSPICPLIE